ncbi:MAG TPA: P1 family peptidase, partial [Acidimicrobiales bacterium]|nr:P1 family peptidase [Acidimicrobiales bacterium]
AGPVPIVVGMVVYDLNVGDPRARPDAVAGYAACVGALAGEEATGRGGVGAGAGATIGKWRGPGSARPAGLGSAVIRHGDVTVAALVVANAVGEPRRPDDALRLPPAVTPVTPGSGENTTIGVVVTDARLDKGGCLQLAEAAHDGLARAIDPVHTGADGDAFVAAATGKVDANVEVLRSLTARVVEEAVLDACAPDQAIRT